MRGRAPGIIAALALACAGFGCSGGSGSALPDGGSPDRSPDLVPDAVVAGDGAADGAPKDTAAPDASAPDAPAADAAAADVPAGDVPAADVPAADATTADATTADATTTPDAAATDAGGDAPPPLDLRAYCWRLPNDEPTGTGRQMNVWVAITNFGRTTVDLSKVKLRHWFTQAPGGTSVCDCDNAYIGCPALTCGFVPVTPARPGANLYVELGFVPGTTLRAEIPSGDIMLRVHGAADDIVYDATDDYSRAAAQRPELCSNVTLYYEGALVWGAEP